MGSSFLVLRHSSQYCLPHGFFGAFDAVTDMARRVPEISFQRVFVWIFRCDRPAFAMEENRGFEIARILDSRLCHFEEFTAEFLVAPVDENILRAGCGIRDQLER